VIRRRDRSGARWVSCLARQVLARWCLPGEAARPDRVTGRAKYRGTWVLAGRRSSCRGRSLRQLGWRSSISLVHSVKATSQDSRGERATTVRFHLQRTTDRRNNLPMSGSGSSLTYSLGRMLPMIGATATSALPFSSSTLLPITCWHGNGHRRSSGGLGSSPSAIEYPTSKSRFTTADPPARVCESQRGTVRAADGAPDGQCSPLRLAAAGVRGRGRVICSSTPAVAAGGLSPSAVSIATSATGNGNRAGDPAIHIPVSRHASIEPGYLHD
jgi:hypothetical protein